MTLGLWFERFISRMFGLSVATYLISIGLLGFSYYPNTQWKWFPLTVTVIAVFVFYYGLRCVIIQQSLFQTNYGLGDEKRLIDPAKIVAESKYKDRTGQKLEDSVMNRAAVISGRAIFIAGLAQSGNEGLTLPWHNLCVALFDSLFIHCVSFLCLMLCVCCLAVWRYFGGLMFVQV